MRAIGADMAKVLVDERVIEAAKVGQKLVSCGKWGVRGCRKWMMVLKNQEIVSYMYPVLPILRTGH